MKKIFLFLVFMLFGLLFLKAQQKSVNNLGGISIHQDHRIESLVDLHVYYNQNHKKIDGYRIMIFFDSGNHSKDKAYNVKEEFEQKYPYIPAYISFNSPYYRVRVGNFRNRIEANKFLIEIEHEYPSAYILKSNIDYPDL